MSCNCGKNNCTDNSGNSRRDFLTTGLTGLLATAALAGCGGAADFIPKDENVALTGEKVKLLSVNGEIIEVDKAYLRPVPDLPNTTKVDERKGIEGKKFVMVIDLARCKNARKCVEGCQKMHHVLPPVEYVKVKEMNNADLTAPYWFPTMCYQCDNPPCTKVCPVDATFKRTDGVVAIDSERCIGCKFCMAACPYSARIFNFGKPEQVAYDKEHNQDHDKCHATERSNVGTVSKCDFCPDSAAKGELPSCVTSCPNGVFYFGDEIEDTVSNGESVVRLSTLLRDNAAYRQFENFGTKPRVYYLPPVNRLFPFKEDPIEHNQEDEINNHK